MIQGDGSCKGRQLWEVLISYTLILQRTVFGILSLQHHTKVWVKSGSNKTRDSKVLWRLVTALWGRGGHWVQLQPSQGSRGSVAAAQAKLGVEAGLSARINCVLCKV